MSEKHSLEASRFLVGEKPYCVWEWDLKKRNLEFLSAMKPGYFRFMAEMIAAKFSEQTSQEAALSIRTLYGHALEAFISLVGAAVQAPDCVPGWLLKYRQEDLETVAEKMSLGRGLATKFKRKPLDWNILSEMVASAAIFESEQAKQKVVQGFAGAWWKLAADVRNEKMYVEYNNIKHGFRVSLGGFHLAVGEEKTLGVQPAKGEMRSLGGSQYGTSFLVPEKLGSSKNHFRLRQNSRNWHPEDFCHRVILISISMENIITFLRLAQGDVSKDLKFIWPEREDVFDLAWKGNVGVTDCSLDMNLDASDVDMFSDDEIRASYFSEDTP